MTADPPADHAPGAPGGETCGAYSRSHYTGGDPQDRCELPAGHDGFHRVTVPGGAFGWPQHPPAPPSADAGTFPPFAVIADVAGWLCRPDLVRKCDADTLRYEGERLRRALFAAQQQHAAEVNRLRKQVRDEHDAAELLANERGRWRGAAQRWEQHHHQETARWNAELARLTADLQAAQQRADGLRELLRLYAIKTDHLADGFAVCLVCDGPVFPMGYPEQHKPECPLATPPTPTGDNRDGANQ